MSDLPERDVGEEFTDTLTGTKLVIVEGKTCTGCFYRPRIKCVIQGGIGLCTGKTRTDDTSVIAKEVKDV